MNLTPTRDLDLDNDLDDDLDGDLDPDFDEMDFDEEEDDEVDYVDGSYLQRGDTIYVDGQFRVVEDVDCILSERRGDIMVIKFQSSDRNPDGSPCGYYTCEYDLFAYFERHHVDEG